MSNEVSNDNEIKLQELILKDYQSKIELSTNAQMHIWQFLVTVNLAYFAGIYYLWSKQCSFYPAWIICLSLLILIINFLLSVIYIREHNAIKDDIDRQNLIYEVILPEFKGKEFYKKLNWNDKYRGITNFAIILFFDLFLLIPLILILLNLATAYARGILLCICVVSIFVFHWFAFFYHNNKIDYKKSKCWFSRSSSKLKITIFIITLVLFIFCLYEFYSKLNF